MKSSASAWHKAFPTEAFNVGVFADPPDDHHDGEIVPAGYHTNHHHHDRTATHVGGLSEVYSSVQREQLIITRSFARA
jgi:hypothetical protein